MTTLLESLAAALKDRYRIERKLGSGGMGTVFLAEDLKHGRPVAIKVMNAAIAAQLGPESFLREIEIVARLTHPHILPLHDSGAASGELYYVSPYIEGETLRARLNREKHLPVSDAIRLAREIANGLGHAHHRGVVHRDIKPENVLLSDGLALVCDFGIARPIHINDPRTAAPGEVVGTPLYMAPELITGGSDADATTDLYALGCLLYEMLAGEPPFLGPTLDRLVHQHLSVEPSPVTDLRPEVPSGVVAVLAKALAKKREDRFPTAARFAEALAVATFETLLPVRQEVSDVPTNLQRERTSFVGRERELAECARLLGESRLLTLVGVGGCGKTRLALKLAESLLEHHPGGVWFVNLAPVSSPERVVQSVAVAMGMQEKPGMSLTAALTQHLGGMRVLLVLDNCEHLLSGCAELTDALLSACPGLSVLATSREGLGVTGERSYPLQPLQVPSLDDDLSRVKANESVRLFVERARASVPEFKLDDETAPILSEICRRLDGIPLAIELAAARTRMLSLAQISTKLDDRFRLLTGGNKALPRHQTLRATIQWSYDHLAPPMQRLFETLAVFDGGWTLAAATAVMVENADEFEVLDLMTGLVDKSLVLVAREAGLARYRMLETIRQFAQERLSESGQGDQARGRHQVFFAAFVEEAEPHFKGPEQVEWFRRVDRELENVLAAHAWCDRAPGGAETGLQLVAGMRLFWTARGLLDLGLRTTHEALARGSGDPATRARAGALLAGGHLAIRLADHDTARRLLERGVPIARALEDHSATSLGLSLLGLATLLGGDAPAAHRYMEEAVAIAHGIDKVTALTSLALALAIEGHPDRAIRFYEQALTLCRELGSITQTLIVLENLTVERVLMHDYDVARENLIEALELTERAALVTARQGMLEIVAMLAAETGEPDVAARLWGAAEGLLQRISLHRHPQKELVLAPCITRAREALGELAFTVAYANGRALPDEAATADARAWLEGPTEVECDPLAVTRPMNSRVQNERRDPSSQPP